jgi:hypothetical protein
VRSFQLQSLRSMSAGEELTISYGATKPNAECLRDYGFIVPGECEVWCRLGKLACHVFVRLCARLQPDRDAEATAASGGVGACECTTSEVFATHGGLWRNQAKRTVPA